MNCADFPIYNQLTIEQNMQILESLTEQQIKRLVEMSTIEIYSTNTQIINEGSIADTFYIIKEGTVNIAKNGVNLAENTVNECFGLMSMMDGSNRSADVIAKSKVTVFTIPYDEVRKPENTDIFQQIVRSQLTKQQSDLRRMNDVTINEVKAKLAESLKKEEASKFFITVVFVLVSYQFVLGLYLEWGDEIRDPTSLDIWTPILTFILGLLGIITAYRSRYDIAEYGFTLANWKADLIQALKWTFPFLGFLILLKWVAIQIPGPFYGEKLIDASNMLKFSPMNLIINYTIYVILVPMQEIVARGVLQGSLMRMLGGKWATLKAILIANCMFSAFHLHLDMKFAILTFIPGLFWGFLYAKQRSLVGVTVSHIIIGLFVLMFMFKI